MRPIPEHDPVHLDRQAAGGELLVLHHGLKPGTTIVG
jgi:hypothetical protein